MKKINKNNAIYVAKKDALMFVYSRESKEFLFKFTPRASGAFQFTDEDILEVRKCACCNEKTYYFAYEENIVAINDKYLDLDLERIAA